MPASSTRNLCAGTHYLRFAAIRSANEVSPEAAEELKHCFSACKDAGMKGSNTAQHGTSFQQTWLGYWRKYDKAPFLYNAARPKKAKLDVAIQAMMRALDHTFAKIAQHLRAVDEETYNRTRVSHQGIIKLAPAKMDSLRYADARKRWHAEHPDRATTSSGRIGGLGSMLAVSTSTGDRTSFHYDPGYADHVYSVILVLSTGGALHLPEPGYKIDVHPGDVVFFQASQQLHKLDVDHSNPGAEQLVFTLWTEENAYTQAKGPHGVADYYTAQPDSGDL